MTGLWTGNWWSRAALLLAVSGNLACSERSAQPAVLAALPGRWVLSSDSTARMSAGRAAPADLEVVLRADGSCSYRAPLSFTERGVQEPDPVLVISEECRWEPESPVVRWFSAAGIRGGISFSVVWHGPSGESLGGHTSARIRELDSGLALSFYSEDPSRERFVDFVRASITAP